MKHIEHEIDSAQKQNASEVRDLKEIIAARAQMLWGTDKQMMELFYKYGVSKRQIAQLIGKHEGTVGRRIKRLTEELVSGCYIRCLRNKRFFTSEQLEITKLYFLGGLNFEEVVQKTGIKKGEVKAVVNYAKVIAGQDVIVNKELRGKHHGVCC